MLGEDSLLAAHSPDSSIQGEATTLRSGMHSVFCIPNVAVVLSSAWTHCLMAQDFVRKKQRRRISTMSTFRRSMRTGDPGEF